MKMSEKDPYATKKKNQNAENQGMPKANTPTDRPGNRKDVITRVSGARGSNTSSSGSKGQDNENRSKQDNSGMSHPKDTQSQQNSGQSSNVQGSMKKNKGSNEEIQSGQH